MTRMSDELGWIDEPQVVVVAWRGPVSALAARLRREPDELLRQIRAVGLARGKKDFALEVCAPGAICAVRRLLARAGSDE